MSDGDISSDDLDEIASDTSFERSISKPHEATLPSDYSSSSSGTDDDEPVSADVGNTTRKLAIKAKEKAEAALLEKKKMIARSTADEGVEVSKDEISED